MKNTLRILVIVSFLALMETKIYSQTVNFTFGSTIDGSTISLFTNEAKVGYDSTTEGLFSIGYFNDGFDVSVQAGLINDPTTLGTFLGNYNNIGTKQITGVAPGFFGPPEAAVITGEVGVGKNIYLMSLGGITDWANASSATEIGLFRDTSWGTIPAGASPTPKDYALESVAFDTVELGKEYLGEILTGAFTGFEGNLYATQAVPEPSTYALFLGVFSLGFVYWRKRLARKNAKE